MIQFSEQNVMRWRLTITVNLEYLKCNMKTSSEKIEEPQLIPVGRSRVNFVFRLIAQLCVVCISSRSLMSFFI